jgi:hypothetical protein
VNGPIAINGNAPVGRFPPSLEVRSHFLEELRPARLMAQKDAEAFDELLFVFERLVCYLHGRAATLGTYRESQLALAARSALGGTLPDHLTGWHSDGCVLYSLVNQARNDALHQGAGARHLTSHAIELALLFEDALMNGNDPLGKLGDIMVRSPATAEPWQPISFIRQVMLTNCFSTLPVQMADGWRVVSDAKVAEYLRAAGPIGRNCRLGATLEKALPGDQLPEAQIRSLDDDIAEVANWFAEHPEHPIVLVCEGKPGDPPSARRLRGIVTAFDIL